MRSAPPFDISVKHYGVWRAGLLLLGATACASLAAWWWAQPVPAPGWAGAVAAVGGLMSLVCVAAAWSIPPLSLRWDRQSWQLSRRGAPEQAGSVQVGLDLGSWMLLRFRPDAASGAHVPTWLPVQRRGLEAQWHALRCAVYSPRPAVGVAAAPDV